jgi:RHS repeat-associated protein
LVISNTNNGVNSSPKKPLGPWKSFTVSTGDSLKASVYAFYQNASTQNNLNISPFVQANPSYGSSTVNGETVPSPFNPQLLVGLTTTVAPPNDSQGNKVPNAYLKLVHYNLSGTIVAEQIVQVNEQNKNAWTRELNIDYYASQAGRVEVFVANESDQNVWFDDFELKYKGAIIAQEMHYDPWGLELRGIGKDGNPMNRFTYNGQSEKQKDLNGGKGYFYETDWRGYDAQLGRFHGIDLLADMFTSITPYRFGFNNPIMFNDPTGLIDNPGFNENTWALIEGAWNSTPKGTRATYNVVETMQPYQEHTKPDSREPDGLNMGSGHTYGYALERIYYSFDEATNTHIFTSIQEITLTIYGESIDNYYQLNPSSHWAWRRHLFDKVEVRRTVVEQIKFKETSDGKSIPKFYHGDGDLVYASNDKVDIKTKHQETFKYRVPNSTHLESSALKTLFWRLHPTLSALAIAHGKSNLKGQKANVVLAFKPVQDKINILKYLSTAISVVGLFSKIPKSIELLGTLLGMTDDSGIFNSEEPIYELDVSLDGLYDKK